MPEIGTTAAGVAAIKLSLFASIIAFLEYFGIPKDPFLFLGVLMLIDMLAGATKQKILNVYSEEKHYKDITSTRFSYGIVKKLTIITVICSVAISIKALGFNGSTLAAAAIAGFVTGEIYSIIRNAYIIYTGKYIPEFEATALILKAILNFARSNVEKRVVAFAEEEKINTKEEIEK